MSIVTRCLKQFKFGPAKSFSGMKVVPVYLPDYRNLPVYTILDESLAKGFLKISEIGEYGSVSQIKVSNISDTVGVLIFNGEQLTGCRQDRSANTTVLVAPASEVILPVSCTERGRWQYNGNSREFTSSENSLPNKAKRKSMEAVSRNLKSEARYCSDQGQVWKDIDDLHQKARSQSQTGAVKDVFREKSRDLDEYLNAFPCKPGQSGIVVCVHGAVIGMEFCSKPEVYTKIHSKLIRSYAIDSILDDQLSAMHQRPAKDMANEFLRQIYTCKDEIYHPPGLGEDHRILRARSNWVTAGNK